MNKICTSLKQSKKLIELGINISTADMHYVLIDSNKEIYDIGFGDYIRILPHYPAWSLSALLELIPNWTMDKADTVSLMCNPYYHCVSCYEDIVDAAFEMVVWLKENGKYE